MSFKKSTSDIQNYIYHIETDFDEFLLDVFCKTSKEKDFQKSILSSQKNRSPPVSSPSYDEKDNLKIFCSNLIKSNSFSASNSDNHIVNFPSSSKAQATKHPYGNPRPKVVPANYITPRSEFKSTKCASDSNLAKSSSHLDDYPFSSGAENFIAVGSDHQNVNPSFLTAIDLFDIENEIANLNFVPNNFVHSKELTFTKSESIKSHEYLNNLEKANNFQSAEDSNTALSKTNKCIEKIERLRIPSNFSNRNCNAHLHSIDRSKSVEKSTLKCNNFSQSSKPPLPDNKRFRNNSLESLNKCSTLDNTLTCYDDNVKSVEGSDVNDRVYNYQKRFLRPRDFNEKRKELIDNRPRYSSKQIFSKQQHNALDTRQLIKFDSLLKEYSKKNIIKPESQSDCTGKIQELTNEEDSDFDSVNSEQSRDDSKHVVNELKSNNNAQSENYKKKEQPNKIRYDNEYDSRTVQDKSFNLHAKDSSNLNTENCDNNYENDLLQHLNTHKLQKENDVLPVSTKVHDIIRKCSYNNNNFDQIAHQKMYGDNISSTESNDDKLASIKNDDTSCFRNLEDCLKESSFHNGFESVKCSKELHKFSSDDESVTLDNEYNKRIEKEKFEENSLNNLKIVSRNNDKVNSAEKNQNYINFNLVDKRQNYPNTNSASKRQKHNNLNSFGKGKNTSCDESLKINEDDCFYEFEDGFSGNDIKITAYKNFSDVCNFSQLNEKEISREEIDTLNEKHRNIKSNETSFSENKSSDETDESNAKRDLCNINNSNSKSRLVRRGSSKNESFVVDYNEELEYLHNLLLSHSAKISAGIMSVERRGTKALELWTRRATEGYHGVSIDNMTTSWRNGLAFCALIHHFRPDLIDLDSLKPENVLENNALAFRIAEQHLGIPPLLDPEDMLEVEVPDRLSILTYVSQFYQAFNALGLIGRGGRKSPTSPNISPTLRFKPQNANLKPPSPVISPSVVNKNMPDTNTTTSNVSANVTSSKASVSLASLSSPKVEALESLSIPQKSIPKTIAMTTCKQPITLQTETGFKADKVSVGKRGRSKEECTACKKPVFLAEKIVAGCPGQLRHRKCFRCARCDSQLTLASYYETETGQFCCEMCPDEEIQTSSTDSNNLSASDFNTSIKINSPESNFKFSTTNFNRPESSNSNVVDTSINTEDSSQFTSDSDTSESSDSDSDISDSPARASFDTKLSSPDSILQFSKGEDNKAFENSVNTSPSVRKKNIPQISTADAPILLDNPPPKPPRLTTSVSPDHFDTNTLKNDSSSDINMPSSDSNKTLDTGQNNRGNFDTNAKSLAKASVDTLKKSTNTSNKIKALKKLFEKENVSSLEPLIESKSKRTILVENSSGQSKNITENSHNINQKKRN